MPAEHPKRAPTRPPANHTAARQEAKAGSTRRHLRLALAGVGVVTAVTVVALLLTEAPTSDGPALLDSKILPRVAQPGSPPRRARPRPPARRSSRPTPRRPAARPLFTRWRKAGYTRYAMAFPRFDVSLLNARVFRGPAKEPKVIGQVRRGTLLPAGPRVYGPGCPGGRWHRVPGGGAVCTSKGFDVSEQPPRFRGPRQHAPDTSRAVPFRYGKVTRQAAPLLRRRPTEREVLALREAEAGRAPWPKVVQRRMRGIYILALDRQITVGGTRLYRTVRGQYVFAEDLAIKAEPKMRGERLPTAAALPLAFVIRGRQPRFRLLAGTLTPAGQLPKHARFHVQKLVTVAGVSYVMDDLGRVMRRDSVRLVRQRKRPVDVPAGQKWIHINLPEQTLVAYEGNRPVYATLVSSGKPGYSTRSGLFRIGRKYLSTTMDAVDPVDGFYRIEEVPWTMYYWRSYAIHGAFWHDDFGVTRSHGCTNVAPADARWLFGWTTPALPAGWHARLGAQGTWFFFTR